MSRSKVQAAEVTYELHTLGWKAFQNLCVTIAAEVWGQTVQGFFDSNDGGRDGAFHGKWKTASGELFEGSFTIQCKFTSKADKQLRPGDLTEELEKAKRLAARGLADNYFLFTNAHLSGSTEEELRQLVQGIPGIRKFSAYGSERISQIIRESSRLRMLVPRVYGLGDLSQILDQRATEQAREILSALGDDLAKFVITDAYQCSAKALVEHGFVLLLGEPACGKSTIAAALAVGALDEWGCSTLKVRDADDFVAHSNPNEPKQFFWVDDAFGSTQVDWTTTVGWNRAFPHVVAAIKRGARVLFTSRDYIYRSAIKHLKESALPVIRESQVVIRVEQLTKDEREQILYNHIRLGNQLGSYKSRLKPLLPDVAHHAGFSPETARRLGTSLFTKRLSVSKAGLDDFVAHPKELLTEIIRTLDAGSLSALALVFMRGGLLASPIKMNPDEEHAITLLGGSMADVRNSLNALEGSLLLQTLQGGSYFWRFKHPTIRDAFAAIVAEDRELMDIYLTGTPVNKLLSEVTCGDVGIQGAKVIVPTDRFDALTTRIESFETTKDGSERSLHQFLSYRCDRAYLASYIARYPNFIPSLSFGSYLTAHSDVSVIVRLNELGLLPESKRVAAVATIRTLATSTPDADFLRASIREIIKPSEFAQIMEDVRTILLPKIEDVIRDWRSNYDKKDDPEEHFDLLVSALKEFRDELAEHPDALAQIDAAVIDVKEAVEELRSEHQPEPDSDDFGADSSSVVSPEDSRSIFDDVDHD